MIGSRSLELAAESSAESLARVAHEGKTKSWRQVVSKLTGRCSNAHANGGTHAGGAALSGAVDPIRIPVVAIEHPLGQ